MGPGSTPLRSERHHDQSGREQVGITLGDRPATRKATQEEILGIVEQGGPLIEGTHLRCPGCESVSDILEYLPLEYSERYSDQVLVPLKCRHCRHVFCLKP